ncbi:PREDICTED: dual specificity protein phosphatase 13 isoform A-like [Gekko japonicus]|uniref:Dual specificity protein phosphatase n=1 Tax=Gekko japonicus TaxID=146911 RepID=A0ABM1K2C8_GEKJA|nr:PREDICTED: dual specificity protein phosphatase 13 isoform A-like [Gekko japonicus]
MAVKSAIEWQPNYGGPRGVSSVTAHNRFGLWKMGISHVLNAAHGMIFCKGSHGFYGPSIEYYGVPAHDLPNFDLSPYFYPAAEFIHKALSIPGAMSGRERCLSAGVSSHCA